MGVDVPLPSRTREEEGGLCPDAPLAAQPPEGYVPLQLPEEPPATEDALEYVPQEIEIPPGKNGQPGKWCSFHQSTNHNLDDCRKINDIPMRKKNGECYTCGELGHISRDCPQVTGPQKARARKGAPQQGKHAKSFADASTQTEEDAFTRQPLAGPDVTISSWEQTFIHGGAESGGWDLPGHVVTIRPGPSGPPQKYWIARWLASTSKE